MTLELLSAPNPGNSLVSSVPADILALFSNLSIIDGYRQGSAPLQSGLSGFFHLFHRLVLSDGEFHLSLPAGVEGFLSSWFSLLEAFLPRECPQWLVGGCSQN